MSLIWHRSRLLRNFHLEKTDALKSLFVSDKTGDSNRAVRLLTPSESYRVLARYDLFGPDGPPSDETKITAPALSLVQKINRNLPTVPALILMWAENGGCTGCGRECLPVRTRQLAAVLANAPDISASPWAPKSIFSSLSPNLACTDLKQWPLSASSVSFLDGILFNLPQMNIVEDAIRLLSAWQGTGLPIDQQLQLETLTMRILADLTMENAIRQDRMAVNFMVGWERMAVLSLVVFFVSINGVEIA
jgi:hypothetical protein